MVNFSPTGGCSPLYPSSGATPGGCLKEPYGERLRTASIEIIDSTRGTVNDELSTRIRKLKKQNSSRPALWLQ